MIYIFFIYGNVSKMLEETYLQSYSTVKRLGTCVKML